ncbi:MAG: pilus assembly protein HicB, partial [Firmicutes bacterium]|nr:pilus assembly protein HicB [Bacillota bacterium]
VINVSKLADKAGINASQLRQYRSGLSKASQKQYDKLEECVHEIGKELITARF